MLIRRTKLPETIDGWTQCFLWRPTTLLNGDQRWLETAYYRVLPNGLDWTYEYATLRLIHELRATP